MSFAGFCFASVQGCLLTFFVTQLTMEIGYTLAVAGAAFSAMQFSGTFARVIMGWLADKMGGPRALILLAILSSIMILVVSRIAPGWPVWPRSIETLCARATPAGSASTASATSTAAPIRRCLTPESIDISRN